MSFMVADCKEVLKMIADDEDDIQTRDEMIGDEDDDVDESRS